jgi:16S rRNA (cytosine967-C5)-methyltransferase
VVIFSTLPVGEKILLGFFLCSTSSNEMLNELKPEWNEKAAVSTKEKCSISGYQCSITNIFSWKGWVSEEIDYAQFCESFLIQPDLFLRIRPGMKKVVEKKLLENKIAFKFLSPGCISLQSSVKADNFFTINKEVVIQDLNSQKVLEPLVNYFAIKNSFKAWDCCAASGGKSFLLMDQFKNIDLTVSDVRQNILHNLHTRFKRAGIKNYKSFVADLSHSPLTTHHSLFDLIICDAPCTGSGTWSRTPEQLLFFNEEKMNEYADLQRKIATNASKSLKQGGYILYITCSVFKKENEGVVEYLQQNTSLQLKSMKYFQGYEMRADTLFVALFTL